jgi:hypothetical protein
VSPSARTRIETSLKPPPAGVFDVFDPANVSPMVAWLATAACETTGRVFLVRGGEVRRFDGWHDDHAVQQDTRWTVAEVATALEELA